MHKTTTRFWKCFDSKTYIVAGVSEKKSDAERLAEYLRTRFVRFLVSQLSFSQDITKERFLFVPVLSMGSEWIDEALYKRYGLTKKEIEFIESKIRPMERKNE